MWKRTSLLIALGLAASACTTSTLETTTTTIAPPEHRVVVATTGGSIVVYDESFTELSRWDPPDRSYYRMPTWLSGGRVVFSEVSEIGDHALIAGDPDSGAVVWRVGMSSSPFYFDPAPDGSTWDTTSLRNDPQGGLIAELIDRDGTVREIGREAPWYTSWSPDGRSLAIHVPGDRLDILTGDEVTNVLETSGGYQAPVWIERGLVLLRDVAGERHLSVWSDGDFEDIAVVSGLASFVAAGTRIAIRVSGDGDTAGGVQASVRTQTLPTVGADRLTVIDLETGSFDTVTTEPTGLFQWDPSGERLLFGTADPSGLTWAIWTEGNIETLGTYRPEPQWVTDLVPFFDQYAQSVRFWRGDGSGVVVGPDGAGSVFTGTVESGSLDGVELDAVWVSVGG